MSECQQEAENERSGVGDGSTEEIVTARNFAVGDPKYRSGEKAFTDYSFYELAEHLKGMRQCYSMYLSYGERFAQHVREECYSVKGWNGEGELAYFYDIPVDFDAPSLEQAFEDCKRFVENELLAKGIDSRHFVIYLSGGKGFHVHISAACFEGGSPMVDAARRFKLLAEQWQKEYETIDLSIYHATSLIRLPGTKHGKSGLYKTEIPLELFTLEYVNRREEWASTAQEFIRRPSREIPPQLIEVPEWHLESIFKRPTEKMSKEEVEQSNKRIYEDFDQELQITANCPLLKEILRDPSNGGKEGRGRDKRRNAIGIILRACPPGEPNPELEWFMAELFKHPYMTKERKDDVLKWVREYLEDGEIKIDENCQGLGCESAQRKICKTCSPLDWKIKVDKLAFTSIEEARARNRTTIQEIIGSAGNGITVLNLPVGIGKTHELIESVSGDEKRPLFWLAPRHALVAQTQMKFEEKGFATRHLASRAYLIKIKKLKCPAFNQVETAQRNGYGPIPCSNCPRKQEEEGGDADHTLCEYYAQLNGLKDIPIVLGVHEHLHDWIYEKAGVRKRPMTVIDESPIQNLVEEIKPIAPVTLGIVKDSLEKASVRAEEKKTAGFRALANPRGLFGKAVGYLDVKEARHDIPCLSIFSDVFNGQVVSASNLSSIDRADVRATWIEFAKETSLASGLARESSLDEEWAYLAIPFPFNNAQRLLAAGQTYDPTKSSYLSNDFPPNKTVILDATANKTVYDTALAPFLSDGRPYTFIEHPLVEQPYSHTVQLTNASYGVGVLKDEAKKDYLVQVVRQLRKKHPGESLLICHKEHESYWHDEFVDDPDLDIAHFGALKGLNTWEDCVAEYIIGTPFVPDSALLELGKKMGIEIAQSDLDAAQEIRRVRLVARNDERATTKRRVFRGLHFYTAASQMLSQGEVTQAVRLRLYNKPRCGKQHLYIFSNVELKGMYADELLTLDELAAREGVQKGTKGEKETAFQGVEEWFGKQPIGTRFLSSRVQADADLRYIREWLRVAAANGWVEKRGEGRGTSYIKLSELQ